MPASGQEAPGTCEAAPAADTRRRSLRITHPDFVDATSMPRTGDGSRSRSPSAARAGIAASRRACGLGPAIFFRTLAGVQWDVEGGRPRAPGAFDPAGRSLTGRTARCRWNLNRRQLLLAGGAAWLGAGRSRAPSPASQKSAKKVLFFTKSSGFQHSVDHPQGRQAQPRRADPDRDRQGARLRGRRLQGRPAVRPRQDRPVGRLRLLDHRRPDHARHRQDARRCRADGEKAFLDAIRGGKGFIGMHCATDTFATRHRNEGGDDPYIQMIGGEFITHGAQQKVTIDVVDPDFPGLDKGFGSPAVRDQRRVVCPEEPRRTTCT